ncbi:MAG: endonuclease [Frankiales bacterium]|nr:endonuclease [Frankiales bacterium]
MNVAEIEAAADDDWLTALTDAEVRSGLTLWAGRIAAGQAIFLDLVGELDAREAWGGVGIKSAAHWLGWQCSLTLSTAREHVRAARALRQLPLIRAAFAHATVSFSQVRALTRVATPDNEASLLDIARHSTAAQLERVTSGTRRATAAADTEAAHEAYETRSLTYNYDDDGALILRGRFPAEQGAVVVKALEAMLDELRRDAQRAPAEPHDVSAETSPDTAAAPDVNACAAKSVSAETAFDPSRARLTGPAINADALVRLADTVLAGQRATCADPDTYRVLIHIDAATILDDAAGEVCAIDDGPTVPAETVRRLLCDTSVRAVTELADGTLLDLGRTARFPNRALRRALRHRDRDCQWPGCTQTRRLDAHHLTPWSHGGDTNLKALIPGPPIDVPFVLATLAYESAGVDTLVERGHVVWTLLPQQGMAAERPQYDPDPDPDQ